MEIEKTINKYENGLKKKEKKNREKNERRLKEDRQFYKEIEKTINKYENGLKKKEKDNRKKNERRLKEERQFYKELEEFIADTAVPTFKKAKTEIHNLGYACEYEVFQIYNKGSSPN